MEQKTIVFCQMETLSADGILELEASLMIFHENKTGIF